MTADTVLRCGECGGEGRLVRINAHLIRPGHVQNPRNRMHPFTLSRSADDDRSLGGVGSRRLSGRREDASHLIATATRGARKGRSRTAEPSGTSSSAGRARRVGDASPAPAPRSARSAGSI